MAPKSILLSLFGISIVAGVFAYRYINSNSEIVENTQIKNSKVGNKIYKTIREVLKDKRPLNTKDETNSNLWKQLINKLLSSDINQDKKIKIEGFLASSLENDNFNIAILKHTCERLLDEPENYEKDKENAENWCTEESQFLKSQT